MALRVTTSYLIAKTFFLVSLQAIQLYQLQNKDWETDKSEHFIVYYAGSKESAWIEKVLRKAEYYYDKVADHIGYARYNNYWTWEDRAKIFIFPDKMSYAQNTGYPPWTKGVVFRDQEVFKSKVIVTYKQEDDFMEGVLPHEIGHLILHDFIGFEKKIPRWFDEGVAQLQEKDKVQKASQYMQMAIAQNKYYPLSQLMSLDINSEVDFEKVVQFYAQSVSLIDFMISKYGKDRFGELCYEMKDNLSFEDALKKVYPTMFDSLEELEEKYLKYFQQNEFGL